MKKKTKTKRESYRTIGVRFLNANVAQVYTYRILKRHPVHLGQLLVVDNDKGISVVAVVHIDKEQQPCAYELKTITQKVAEL